MKKPNSQKKSSSKNKSDNPVNKDFIVVGLGASAGGVRALQDFFASMPPNSGMAFVVVLHLAPDHESNLAEILQAQTMMPVVRVDETHKVERNHVYVIPPNQNLVMFDGSVGLAAPDREKGTRVAIDVFFRTLADAYERNAVCIVLSGTGADGTLGLKRVKEMNGFAVVQHPSDAEYEEMPRNAIATGIADWVLPVTQMPEKLINFRGSSERLHLTGDDAEKVAREINAEDSLREILTILRVRTGHDFSSYKTPTLIRRIARHLQIHELEDIPTYLNFLRENPDEVQSLQRNLLINVTNFFRDRDAFDALEKEVIPRIMDGKTARDTVRVWVAACASGEEAYSVGILLHEYAAGMSDPPKIQIFATDVDDEAIAEAREGVYTDAIETDVSEDRLKRFFVREGNRYRVRKELRESVLFAPHNVLRDPPFSKLDLVTCRNLLIYLNRDSQERVLEIFHFAINLQGFLFLGSSETAESLPSLYSAVDKKNRIYQRRAAHGIYEAPPRLPVVGQWQVRPPGTTEISNRNKAFDFGEMHYKLLENLAPPSILVNQDFDVVYMSESVGRFLHFKGGVPTNNVLKLVHKDLQPDLRTALFTAKHERKTFELPKLRFSVDGNETVVNLSVRPVNTEDDSRDLFLVIFEEAGRNPFRISADGDTNGKAVETPEYASNKDAVLETIVERLETDLQRTKAQLRATVEQHEVTIEDLKASNEELQAINEELRSAGEELETSKEELQSVNEELITVNHELKEKIDEVSRTNSDLQNLMSSTHIATIFLDSNLRIQRFTPPVEDLFNIKQNDLGRPLEHFTNRLNYENIGKEATGVLRTLKPFEREVADSDGRFFLMRLLPYRSLDDRIEGVVMNFVDITERKRAETAKHFLASIVESSEDSMITVDFDRKITSWNKASEKLYGYRAAEVIGKSLSLLTLPDDIKKILADIDKIKHSRKVEIFDSIRLNKDGREMNLEVVLSPVKDGAGEVIGVATLARNVTEPRLAQAAKYHLAAIVESSQDSMVSINLEGVITSWNKAAEQLYGYPAAEAVGKSLTELTLPQNLLEVLGNIENVRHSQKVEVFDSVRLHKDSREIHLEVVMSPVKDETGQVIGVSTMARDVTERRRAVEALRESEEHFKLMVNTVPQSIWITDAEGRVEFLNKQWYDYCGATEGQATAAEVAANFIHPDDAAKVMEAFAEAMRAGRAFEVEQRNRSAAGEYRWFLNRGNPYRDPKTGEITKWFGISVDIHARVQAEEALRESEARFRAMFEQASVGIVQVTMDGQLVMPNQGFCKIIGYSEQETQRLNLRDITHPDDYENETKLTRQLISGEIPGYSIEKRYVRKDGKIVWGNMTASVVFRTENDPQYAVAIVEDITGRKEASEALRKSEEHLRLILESTKDYAIVTYDLEGRVTRWNAGAENIFGFSEEEAVGQMTHFVFTPEDIAKKAPEQELEGALKKGRAEDERWHVRKDGSRFFASGVMQPLRDGTTQGFVKICRDQTERLKAETVLRDKEMLTQLVTTQEEERRRIAREIHDHVGQQVTVLRLKLEEAKKACGDSGEACDAIDMVKEITERLDREVDFLAWELRPASLDDLGLRLSVENFVREFAHHTGIKAEFHELGMKRAKLAFEVETNLYRIMQEALNNIQKHAKAKNVSVLLEKRSGNISLIIEDDGVGFNPKDKKNRSKGIGLTGMNERAKICGGTLEIESKKGKGTTIYARIPAKK